MSGRATRLPSLCRAGDGVQQQSSSSGATSLAESPPSESEVGRPSAPPALGQASAAERRRHVTNKNRRAAPLEL